MPKKRGKKYIEAAKKVEAAVASNGNGGLDTVAAVALAKETSISKFDATVEVHIRLGVDPRHAEQMVRGSVVLPNGTGKKVRVAVFATADKAKEAQEAGAEFVGGDDWSRRYRRDGPISTRPSRRRTSCRRSARWERSSDPAA